MKAISVRQPWAWGIIYSTKNIENRGWPINYRGDILIHAAKKCTKKEYEIASIFFQTHIPHLNCHNRLLRKLIPRKGVKNYIYLKKNRFGIGKLIKYILNKQQ